MESKRVDYSVNRFRVCIDYYCKEQISGRVYSPLCQEAVEFVGIGEMLLQMDKLFDRVGYPQSFQNKRSFEKKKAASNSYQGIPGAICKPEEIVCQKGKYFTCDITVESRRNASWQGILQSTEGKERRQFDGEMQLLAELEQMLRKEN